MDRDIKLMSTTQSPVMRDSPEVFGAFELHILSILSGLCAPLVLIFVIHFTANSEVVEEICKLLFVLFVSMRIIGIRRFYYAGLFAVTFAISESVLYLNTIIQIRDISLFWDRILITLPMHVLTTWIIVVFSFGNKKKIVIGLILAIILHMSFNYVVDLHF